MSTRIRFSVNLQKTGARKNSKLPDPFASLRLQNTVVWRLVAVMALMLCCVMDAVSQTASLPMLKNGGREVYAQFTRPKITVGLAMMLPPEANYREQVMQGFNSVTPDENAEDVSLYFKVAADLVVTATGTFYVAVEYLDQGRAAMELEYVRESGNEKIKQRERFFLGGSGNWRRHVFTLRDALLNGSFPANTDFRLINPNIYIRRISVSRVPPAGSLGPVGPVFQQPTLNLPAGFMAGVLVDDSIPDADWQDERRLESRAQLYRSWGAQFLIDTVQPRKTYGQSGQWDASLYRARAERVNRVGLQWTPRLVVGSYEHLPVALAGEYQRAMTAQDRASGPMMSIWEPRMVQLYDGFLADLRRRLGAFTPQTTILSVAGDWGPLLLSHEMSGQSLQPDIWAGDPHAQRSFVEFIRQRHGSLNGVRSAWSENILSWDQVRPLSPSSGKPQKAADIDDWLRASLTDLTGRLTQSVKRHFPNSRLVLDIGDDFRYNAVDIPALARLASNNQASIVMVTQEPNPTDHYAWQSLATACREHGVPFGLRIHRGAYRQDLLGVLFALVSENAAMIVIHEDDLSGENAWEQYAATMQGWRASAPVRQAAVIYPRYAAARAAPQEFARIVKETRDLFAFDVVDETSLERLTPAQYPLLIAPWGDVWSDGAHRALDRLVRGGAVLLVRSHGPWNDLQGRTNRHDDLFNVDLRQEGEQWVARTRGPRDQPYQQQQTQPVERITLPIGSPAAGGYLYGQWSEPLDRRTAERHGLDYSSFRWLNERGGARFMMQPRRDYTLHIEGHLPEDQVIQVNLNGRPFGVIEGEGHVAWKADLIGQWRPRTPQLEIELRGRARSVGQAQGEAQQASMAVHRIGVTPRGETLSETVDAGVSAINVGWANLPGAWVRDRGRGYTIFIPSAEMNEWAFAELASAIMSNPALIEPRLRFSTVVDGRRDGVFISPQRAATVYYNSGRQPAEIAPARGRGAAGIIPPRSILYR